MIAESTKSSPLSPSIEESPPKKEERFGDLVVKSMIEETLLGFHNYFNKILSNMLEIV